MDNISVNNIEKFLLTIEFRYDKAPKFDSDFTCMSKTITIGVFDNFDDAAINGNKALEIFENLW